LEDGFTKVGRPTLVLRLSLQMTWLAEAYLIAGRTRQAAKTAQDALLLAQRNGEKGQEAWALWLLGTIHQRLQHSGDIEAERCLHGALKIASSRHMAPLIAHCHFALGTLSARGGSRHAARRQVDDAFVRYRQLEMNHWVDIAEAELDGERQGTPMLIGFR
jgi:hypothetical protein